MRPFFAVLLLSIAASAANGTQCTDVNTPAVNRTFCTTAVGTRTVHTILECREEGCELQHVRRTIYNQRLTTAQATQTKLAAEAAAREKASWDIMKKALDDVNKSNAAHQAEIDGK